jgi:hypothetical protein
MFFKSVFKKNIWRICCPNDINSFLYIKSRHEKKYRNYKKDIFSVHSSITSLGIVFASFIHLIYQTTVNNIMQHEWFFFAFLDIRAWVDLCMIALESIWVGNGDVMHHGCTLSAWVQQAEFNIILLFKPLDQEHSELCCSFAK